MTENGKWPEPGPQDVALAYEVFLGRSAEHAYASTWSSSADLARHFIASEEFDVEVAQAILNGRFPPSNRFIAPPNADILQWMGSFLPVSSRTRGKLGKAASWVGALHLLFADREFRQLTQGEREDWTINALAAILAKMERNARSASGFSDSGGAGIGRIAQRLGVGHKGTGVLGRDLAGSDVGDTPRLVECVMLILNSSLFDRDYYAQSAKLECTPFDLAKHYLLRGESEGLRPSPNFDPELYKQRHRDVHDAGLNALLHYEMDGRREGRRADSALVDRIALREHKFDRSKSTIVLVCHQASRTGAPILGWNLVSELSALHNVVVVLIDGGELEAAFNEVAAAVVGPVRSVCSDPIDLRVFATRIIAKYKPVYVLANSVEANPIAVALRQQGCALVLLVHEFSSHSNPRGVLQPLYQAADHIVFPASIVARSSIDDYDHLRLQNVHILPQGPSRIPVSRADRHAAASSRDAATKSGSWVRNVVRTLRGYWQARPPVTATSDNLRSAEPSASGLFSATRSADPHRGAPYDFLVVGLGSVDLRKGVDLFLATAVCLRRIAPKVRYHFVWIGHDFQPDGQFQILLREQVSRSGLGESFQIFEAMDELEAVYDRADALFISSRLDPLPNVAIDASLRGLPVICFQKSTGMAEFLEGDDQTAFLAVPHLDIAAAAEVITSLSRDKQKTAQVAARLVTRARETFDMPRYAARLDELGMAASRHAKESAGGAALLAKEGNFEAALFAGKSAETLSKDVLISRYLNDSRRIAFAGPPAWGIHPRRPLPGFHPMEYAAKHPRFPRDSGANPLLHYLKEGRPEGSWKHQSIRVDDQRGRKSALKAVIHGHFHYTENYPDFLKTLAPNKSSIDLIITTTSEKSAKYLKKASQGYRGGDVTVRVVSNVGRDVGPFLTLLGAGTLDGYDSVCHIHGKRSPHTMSYDSDLGNRWRVFLWEHLLGPSMPTADIILHAMEEDTSLGLVFPQNPEVVGWELNLSEAEKLAERMGLELPLPVHIDFPVGTMFWARPKALQPFVAAGLTASDYPEEPLPIDGTMLHAVERLLTPAAVAAGYRYASVYNPRRVRT
jgi:glycosyltransferase involved in cell wall biosynthesis